MKNKEFLDEVQEAFNQIKRLSNQKEKNMDNKLKGFKKSLKSSIKSCEKMGFYYKIIGDANVVLKIRVQYKEIAQNLENMERQMTYLLDETNETGRNIAYLKEIRMY